MAMEIGHRFNKGKAKDNRAMSTCIPDCIFSFGRTGTQRTRSSTKLGKNQNANLRTLGVRYPLLVVEGQGTHPRASGIRKQVWVCGADAGVCHAWKAAGKVSKDIAYQ